MNYEIILSLKDIPENSIVRKIGGEKTHVVKKSIKIYTEDKKDAKELNCDSGFVFLTSGNCSVNMYAEDKKFVWIVDEIVLENWIKEQRTNRWIFKESVQ